MKFQLSKNQLASTLDKVSMALPTRSTSNILMGLLIEVDENGTMRITGSDNEIRIEQTIEVSEFESGKIVLPGKLFVSIVRSMPDEEITVTCGEDHIATVATSRSSFRIASLDAREYPLSDPYEEDKTIRLQKETFIDIIGKTTFAASKVDSRGVLVGVLLDIGNDGITFVSLDGFRMAVVKAALNQPVEEPSQIIISARILNEIVKLITSADFEGEEIEIGFNEIKRNARIVSQNTRITISLINGKYLEYANLLPQQFQTEAVISRDALRHSVERAALMSTDGRNNLIKLKFTENDLNISAKSDSGHFSDNIPVTLKGPEIEIGFNAKYILDGLKAINEDTILFSLETSIKPCTITPEGGDYVYMILPVRVS